MKSAAATSKRSVMAAGLHVGVWEQEPCRLLTRRRPAFAGAWVGMTWLEATHPGL